MTTNPTIHRPTTVYYHGGRANLQRGAFLLPPTITKAASCSEFGAAGVHRKDRVYITTSFDAAVMFAAGQRNGMVYQCEPIGAIEDDPDCSATGMSFQCERARITKVIKLSKNELEFARQVMLGARERA